MVVTVRGSEKELKEFEPAATAVHRPPNVNPREAVGFQILVPIRTSADESAALVVVNIRQGCPALFAIAGSYRLPKCLRVLHIFDSRPESSCIQIGCSALEQHQPADP